MNMELVQGMIDIVFKGNMIFLAPFLLVLMTVLFSDTIISLIYRALGDSGGRRSRY
jgi:hypothetical protein